MMNEACCVLFKHNNRIQTMETCNTQKNRCQSKWDGRIVEKKKQIRLQKFEFRSNGKLINGHYRIGKNE